jgi:hypothetical protein
MDGSPAAAAPVGEAWAITRFDWRGAAAPAGAGVLVLLVGANSGGYYPTAWGWTGIVLAWVAALALLLAPGRVAWLDVAAVTALTAYVAWVALTRFWSDAPGHTITEVQRDLVYPLALLAALLLVRRSTVGILLGAVAIALDALALYALTTRLFPERLGTFDSIATYRLSAPLGYWNTLGILTALAILLTLGFAARGGLIARHLAAAALVGLAPTLYFTFSRGGVIALGIGLVAIAAVDTRRLQLTLVAAVVVPFAALAVWYASRADALITTGAPLRDATHDGHRVAAIVAALAVAAVAARLALTVGERVYRPSDRARRGYAALVASAVVVLLAVTVARLGGPVEMVENAYDSFRSPPVGSTQTGANLSKRFASLSSNGRLDLWNTALDEFRDSRVVGSGAGSFEWYWAQHRPYAAQTRDAHSLYVETLAEMGGVGLVLIALALLLPFAALRRARRTPLVPFAAAAYVAFLAHIGVDWDWEMPVVILTGLFCATAMLVAGRRDERLVTIPAPARWAGAATIAAVGVFALVGLVGSSALAAADRDAANGSVANAERQARKATVWERWSAEPWKTLASIQQQRGERAAALRSLRRAVELEPRDSDAWYQIAVYAPTVRERRHAAAQYRRLDPLDPPPPTKGR